MFKSIDHDHRPSYEPSSSAETPAACAEEAAKCIRERLRIKAHIED